MSGEESMHPRKEDGPRPAADPLGADYESTPITRPEYISAMVHLYRGELYRATTWRIRLDATTNWAVLTTAGLLSVAFGTDEIHSHVVLLIGMSLITVFWAFESRRYRIADVWYSRLRKIEENFYGPILRRDPQSPRQDWGSFVAEDLFTPSFKVTRLEALRARFLRNYWAIYSVLLIAWVLRLFLGTHGTQDLRARLTFGPLPYWVPLLILLVVLGGILLLLVSTRGSEAEKEPDHWQIPPEGDARGRSRRPRGGVRQRVRPPDPPQEISLRGPCSSDTLPLTGDCVRPPPNP